MIIIQKNLTRDIIGLSNALSSFGKEVMLWDQTSQDLKDVPNVEMLILNDITNIGHQTLNSVPKLARVVLINNEDSNDATKNRANLRRIKLPLCADDILYPDGFFIKKFACDVSYISNFTIDTRPYVVSTLGKLSAKKWKMRFPGSIRLELAPYMGAIARQNVVNLCKSSKVCIDFDFNIAIDLVYNGCKVITNVDNNIIPIFNEDNINEIIEQEIDKPVPVINELREKLDIVSYREYIPRFIEEID